MSKIRRYRNVKRRVNRGSKVEDLVDIMTQLGLQPQLHDNWAVRNEYQYGTDDAYGNLTFQIPLDNGEKQLCVADVPLDRQGRIKGTPIFLIDTVMDKKAAKRLVDAITTAINHKTPTEIINLPAGLNISEVREIAQGLGARLIDQTGVVEPTRTLQQSGVKDQTRHGTRENIRERSGAKARLQIGNQPIVTTFESPFPDKQIVRKTEAVLEIRRTKEGNLQLVVPEQIKARQEGAIKNLRRLSTGLVAIKAQSTKAEIGSTLEPAVHVERGLVQQVDVEWIRPEALKDPAKQTVLTRPASGFGMPRKAPALTPQNKPEVVNPSQAIAALQEQPAPVVVEQTNNLLDPSRLRIDSHEYARNLVGMAKQEHVTMFAN